MTWYIVTKDEPGHIKRIGEEADRATTSKQHAEQLVKTYGGHVVTLIEEPEKAVLTKKQAKIVDNAHTNKCPANYITGRTFSSDEEELLMNAYVNGYTVEKEKKYNVKVPHTKDVWYYKDSETYLQTICSSDKELHGKFTEADIEHYGLQDCERVVCADSARTTGEEE